MNEIRCATSGFGNYLIIKAERHYFILYSTIYAFYKSRISVHSLMCEIGRYCNTPYEQWLCRLCEMHKVESEHHFIFECSYYSDFRNLLSNQLTKDRDRHPVRHMYSLLSCLLKKKLLYAVKFK